VGRHSTPDQTPPPSSGYRDVPALLARPRLVAAVVGVVLAVLLGLAVWAVNRADGGRDGLADGTGGGGLASAGTGAPPSAGLQSPTPDATAVSGSAAGVVSATASPSRASASPARPAPSPAGLTAAFRQTQSWNGGYQAEYTISNRGTAAVTGWTVVVTFSGAADPNYWDADAVTGTGNRITFTAKSYNATVPAGGSVTFGMVVSGSPPATPVACTVNGRPC
jgi:hypothetical protein